MPVLFTTAQVLDAIRAGHTTINALADHFKVPAASYNLRADLADLTNAKLIDVAATAADGTKTFTPTFDKDGIPIHHGPGVSQCCWVNPGEAHTLSCEHVTPEQVRAFINNR